MLAVGLPVVCNVGIGDIEQQMQELNAGYLIGKLGPAAYRDVIEHLDDLLALRGEALRDRTRKALSLEFAAARYVDVYRQLEGQRR